MSSLQINSYPMFEQPWKTFVARFFCFGLMLFIALAAVIKTKAQSRIKPRGSTVAETQLKREIGDLKKVVLGKIEQDIDKTAEAFANSENIFRSLRVAYSFDTVLDSVNDSFAIFGLPNQLKDIAEAKNLTEAAANSSLAAGSVLLVWENMKENAGKLEMVFNSGRYIDNVRQMLKEAGSTQPLIGFDAARYTAGVKFQLGANRGQEILIVSHRRPKNPCQVITPRGEASKKDAPLKGSVETRHYIINVFQKIEKEIDGKEISDSEAGILTILAKQIKENFLRSNLQKTEFTLSLPRAANCNPAQTKILLGRIAERQKPLSSAYSALNENLRIEQFGTLKTAGDAMLGATTYYFKDGTAIKEVIETAGKVSLAIDMGDSINKRLVRQEIDPAELIGSLPQEMLLSLPAELSDTVLAVDVLASFIVRPTIKSELPPKPPIITATEIPTMFLLDVSSSMLDGDKIAQAKSSALNALREMQENRRRGRGNSSVAVWLFGGECSPRSIREILPFTTDLAQAEMTFRSKIPKPDGSTPLFTAINKSVNLMTNHLAGHPGARQGRVILLSDGENTCDEQIRPRGVYSTSGAIVYKQIEFLTIGFNVPVGSKAERDLQYLASSSGGKYFPAENQQQLARAFEKTVRVYLPKNAAGRSAEFERGVAAMLNRDYESAIAIFKIYVQANPTDALGFYNLALACEATERYQRAVENYKKYLQLAATDNETETRIVQLEEDYRVEISYYLNLLQSDLDYLKEYYKRLFGLKNDELAAEFAGFVAEKGAFYRRLPEILEIRTARIGRNSQDLADSLDNLNRRVNLSSFDRDAVSLLTVPISHLEEMIERIETFNAQNPPRN